MLKTLFRNFSKHPILDNQDELIKYVDDLFDFVINEYYQSQINCNNLLEIQRFIIKKRYSKMNDDTIDNNFRGAYSIGILGNKIRTPLDVGKELLLKAREENLINGIAILMLNHELPLAIDRWKDPVYARIDHLFLNSDRSQKLFNDMQKFL